MVMVEAVKKAYIQNYANFKDRTTRADFWWAVLGMFILSFVVGLVGGMIFGNSESGTNILSSIWSLATLIPGLALDVRRMHDIGKSGWAILIALVPLVGWIILLVWLCQPSKAQ